MGGSKRYAIDVEGMDFTEIYKLGEKIVNECSDLSNPLEITLYIYDMKTISGLWDELENEDTIKLYAKIHQYNIFKDFVIDNIDNIFSLSVSKMFTETWPKNSQLLIFNKFTLHNKKIFNTSMNISYKSDLGKLPIMNNLILLLRALDKANILSLSDDLDTKVNSIFTENNNRIRGNDFQLKVGSSSNFPHGFNITLNPPSLEKLFRSEVILAPLMDNLTKEYNIILETNFPILRELINKIQCQDLNISTKIKKPKREDAIEIIEKMKDDTRNSCFIRWPDIKWLTQERTNYNDLTIQLEKGQIKLILDINYHITEDIVSMINEKINRNIRLMYVL